MCEKVKNINVQDNSCCSSCSSSTSSCKPQEEVNENRKKLVRFIAGAIVFFLALILKLPLFASFTLYFISYLIVGYDVIFRAFRNILHGRVFDENFLMCIATFGAFAIREFPEGVAVMLFYQIGEFFQDLAVTKSRKSISELMDIRPDYANLKIEDGLKKVSPSDVKPGDLIIVKPGEKVPLDGIVKDGISALNTTALTGESLPREVSQGSEVLSGSININGVLTVEVTKAFGESTVSKILDLVQNASKNKAQTENFITKFAYYYTPAVVITATALAILPPLLTGANFMVWLNRALVFLVVSCPCALVVSIPLGFFGGIGAASKNGILIKGSNFLEALNNVETIVFDKTGTLTKGIFKVSEIVTKGTITDTSLLEYAAYAESYSNHPIAQSIIKSYGKTIDKSLISQYEEISGLGTKAIVNGKTILAGNSRLMEKELISMDIVESDATLVHIAIDNKYEGYLCISDEIKVDSVFAINSLKRAGIRKLVMLTGDKKSIGEKLAATLDFDEVYSELLPHDKVDKVASLLKDLPKKAKLMFVGDGINDAPVLARADIGVAMGGIGSDAAIEAADIVLMTDEPSKIVTAISIAKMTRKIVWQNIIFAFAVKFFVLLLGAGGLANMWEAVFADVGVALIAILNALRVANRSYHL